MTMAILHTLLHHCHIVDTLHLLSEGLFGEMLSKCGQTTYPLI